MHASIVEELCNLACISCICYIVENFTGHTNPLSTAKLLFGEWLKHKKSTEADFAQNIAHIDKFFPKNALHLIFNTCTKIMHAYESTLNVAPQIHEHAAGGEECFFLQDTESLMQKILSLSSEHKSCDDLLSAEEKYGPSISRISENTVYALSQVGKLSEHPGVHYMQDDESNSNTNVELNAVIPKFLQDRTSGQFLKSAYAGSSMANRPFKLPQGYISKSISDQKQAFDERKTFIKPMPIQCKMDSYEEVRTKTLLQDGYTSQKSIREQRESLAIFTVRQEFLQLVSKEQVIVLIGETGSGKTTQIPQYLKEAGYARDSKVIGCTQPRRLPTRSIAERVAEEMGCVVGEEVGYTMRFEDRTSSMTQIKFMTDGILLREALTDPLFKKYSIVIIDEAHERNINTDLLLGLLKRALEHNDFKLIVTSATLDVCKFTSFFSGAKVFYIQGRTYPVSIEHLDEPLEGEYVYASVKKSMQLHLEEEKGDVLVFLPGKEEIEDAAQQMTRWSTMLPQNFPSVEVHRVYASMPTELQSRLFMPAQANSRKVIFSTNVAETSLTIDGVRFVIDPGVFRQSGFDPHTTMDILRVVPISQAQAKQRAGRAGRTSPGKCYRLYTVETFEKEMALDSIPEIQRSNLASVVLLMKASGVVNVLNFDFIDKPLETNLVHALHRLFSLGALDTDGLLTQHGRKMADYPIDPSMSSVLLKSVQLCCEQEVATILALLSLSDDIFYRPREKADEADERRMRLQRSDGDHMTYLSIYTLWEESKYSKSWCEQNFLNHRALRSAKDVRQELVDMVKAEVYKRDQNAMQKKSISMRVRLAFLSGYFYNVAVRCSDGYKRMTSRDVVYVFPSSAMAGKDVPFIMYHAVIMTSREFIRVVSPIEKEWLPLIAPQFYIQSPTPFASAGALEPLFDKNKAPDDWRYSTFYAKRNRRR